MFQRIDLRLSRDLTPIVRQVTEGLKAGKLVLFPTETVYGIAADLSNPAAVERLRAIKGRDADKPFSVAISGCEQLDDLLPELTPLQHRLARRCWPGPVTLVFPAAMRGSFVYDYSEQLRRAIMPTDQVGFRVPQHSTMLEILKAVRDPVVLTSANLSGQEEMMLPDDIIDTFGDQIDLYLDDGPSRNSKASTVVAVKDNDFQILREGVVSKEAIERLTAKIIIFVCTGNTCRSPMAEVICRHLIAERFHCKDDDVEKKGYVIMSAGVAVYGQSPASSAAQEVMFLRNLSLLDHRSQEITETHVRFADKIYTMTRNHREAILSYWPSADTRLSVLRMDGGDISDPYGGTLTLYERCANQIEDELLKRVGEIIETQE